MHITSQIGQVILWTVKANHKGYDPKGGMRIYLCDCLASRQEGDHEGFEAQMLCGGASSGGGKRAHIEDEGRPDDPGDTTVGLVLDEDNESSDGELTHEDIMERKSTKTAKLKALRQVWHREAGIGKMAASYQIPKATTPLA
ncbi:uncharacterized protein MELLADRAFT_103240 [Melampsora larici-populina 98AG31]|uniref:Uncharacterized protein n=1 Tax=Melampsora larici-populina (strain 98AG31 / pathotype 3-4-7) TaxID=747676 RepID=F4RB02_MELLP|nr:uncharacterized protein MELLADRAFT_103240 [Melampsora larici-populina 98AG31]EGG10686.1 hypothetical protein MELLADRAFT_103240 [Melampsora larici-populina 98AG31]